MFKRYYSFYEMIGIVLIIGILWSLGMILVSIFGGLDEDMYIFLIAAIIILPLSIWGLYKLLTK